MIEERTWFLGILINRGCCLTRGSQEGDSNSQDMGTLKSLVVVVAGGGQGPSARQESSRINGSEEIESRLISAKVRRIT